MIEAPFLRVRIWHKKAWHSLTTDIFLAGTSMVGTARQNGDGANGHIFPFWADYVGGWLSRNVYSFKPCQGFEKARS
jgi:hypothetical protein